MWNIQRSVSETTSGLIFVSGLCLRLCRRNLNKWDFWSPMRPYTVINLQLWEHFFCKHRPVFGTSACSLTLYNFWTKFNQSLSVLSGYEDETLLSWESTFGNGQRGGNLSMNANALKMNKAGGSQMRAVKSAIKQEGGTDVVCKWWLFLQLISTLVRLSPCK